MMMREILGWLLPAFLFGLGFGSKSSQASTTSTANTTQNTDRRIVADGGSFVLGDGSSASVSTTDFGAIKASTDLAELIVLGSTKLATDASAQQGKIAKQAIDNIASAYEGANKQAQDFASGNKTLATLGLIVAAVVGLAAFNRQKA